MSSISKELKLSQEYTKHSDCIGAMTMSHLNKCNFEACHIMHVSEHKSENSISSYSWCLLEVKQREIAQGMLSVVPVRRWKHLSFQSPKHTYVEWNLLGLMVQLLVWLRLGNFLLEKRVICGVMSDQKSMKWSVFPFFWKAKVSNNFTKQPQNVFKISTRDKYATQLR